MALTAKKKKGGRRVKDDALSLPSSATRITLAGKEFVIIPSEELKEWLDDRVLGAVMQHRIREEGAEAVPFTEAAGRIFAEKKTRHGKV